jgi:hypothetical protein
MAHFSIQLWDKEDGTVDVGTEGWKAGDPITDAVKLGSWLANQLSNLFVLLGQLDPSVEELMGDIEEE